METVEAPELPECAARTVAAATLRKLLLDWGLDPGRAGSPQWNPLGEWIRPGSRVVLKPNWVLHENQSGKGTDCLVTHTSVIEAVLEYVALAEPAAVTVGDAPVQGCDFGALRRICGLDALCEQFSRRGFDLQIVDFRRTTLAGGAGGERQQELRPLDRYVLFDVGGESLLEPIAGNGARFRVTLYDPDGLARTHRPGLHQYLVAREVIEADTVINLPKLKSHKKACITGSLKNLIGINGNKEYLPHHRRGGADSGGDCYPGGSGFKRAAEGLMDAGNRRDSGGVQQMLFRGAGKLLALDELFGGDRDIEGSWYGNDTIWRTCLDLQRILHYGTGDGKLAPSRQRSVIHITDAVIAGEGEGPLAPTPVAAGFMTGAENGAAAEWVHARLMGFDPRKIPLVREAFGRFSFALADFSPAEIEVRMDGRTCPPDLIAPLGRAFQPARGWRGHCEAGAER